MCVWKGSFYSNAQPLKDGYSCYLHVPAPCLWLKMPQSASILVGGSCLSFTSVCMGVHVCVCVCVCVCVGVYVKCIVE